MSHFNDSSFLSSYQFPRWSTSITRPYRSSSSKRTDNTFKSSCDNPTQLESPSKQRIIQHSIHIPTESRVLSPPPLFQPTPTPDCYSIDDQLSTVSSFVPSPYLTPLRIQSAELTIPIKTNSEDTSQNSFAKQSHERRKVAQERKRRKQQAQKYNQIDMDAWYPLRQSSMPLKRPTTTATTTEEGLVGPSISRFNTDNYSFETIKQVINEQQKEIKINTFKSESGMFSPMNSRPSSNIRSRTNIPNSQNSLSNSRMTKRPSETYPRPVFEPFIVAAKPLHPVLLTGNTHPSKTNLKLIKPPSSAPPRVRSISLRARPSTKPVQLLTSNPPISLTLPAPVQNVKEEEEEKLINPHPIISESHNYSRPLSNMSLRSTIKLKPQVPRCRSAADVESPLSLNKTYPRFILITDDEHRIESWYHRYPFIISNDFLQSFLSKPKKSVISAYFIDDYQESLNLNKITKGHLQDKPFHINNDWKNYDLIFISDNIYQDIIIYLQTIINLMIKSSGKIIHIYKVNHHEDLKTQVTYISKQLSHI